MFKSGGPSIFSWELFIRLFKSEGPSFCQEFFRRIFKSGGPDILGGIFVIYWFYKEDYGKTSSLKLSF